MWHRCFKHTVCICQGKLHTLGQRGFQRFFGLEAAMDRHHGFEILPSCPTLRVILQERRIKTPPHQRHSGGVVFQQLVIGGQLQSLKHRQRCSAQQGRKPTVKGAYLYRAPLQQQCLI